MTSGACSLSVKILALPRDPNPFQEDLYRRLRARGAVIRYADGPTRSQTLNLVLLPAALAARRFQRYGVLHVHWVFGFVPVWAHGRTISRVFRAWYRFVLQWARLIGMRVVWTAHNVLPHVPVFDDDEAARRDLVRMADHVVAMNSFVADDVVRRFGAPRALSIIPHGVEPASGGGERSPLGSERTFTFFGRVEKYKGVSDLLRAAAELPMTLRLRIVGDCRDPDLRAEIEALAQDVPGVELRLEAVPEPELREVLARTDVVVLPFRTISTSGSLLRAMSSGAPVLVPDLPAFADIPEPSLLRYPPGHEGLAAALSSAAQMTPDRACETSEAARRYLRTVEWDVVAAQYEKIFAELAASPS